MDLKCMYVSFDLDSNLNLPNGNLEYIDENGTSQVISQNDLYQNTTPNNYLHVQELITTYFRSVLGYVSTQCV